MNLPKKFWSEILRKRDHMVDLGVDGSIIFEWILGKWISIMAWI